MIRAEGMNYSSCPEGMVVVLQRGRVCIVFNEPAIIPQCEMFVFLVAEHHTLFVTDPETGEIRSAAAV